MKYVFLSFVVLILACNNQNKPNLSEDSKTIELINGACFGSCPVYRITIFNNGKIHYSGRANVEKLGLWSRQLSKEEFKSVTSAFRRAELWPLDDEYFGDVSDHAATTLVYSEKNKTKKIAGHSYQLPQIVKGLNKLVQQLGDRGDWTLLEARPRSEESPEAEPLSEKNELLVRFKKTTDIADWMHEYEPYGLRLDRRVIPTDDTLWVLTYEKDKMPVDKLLSIVRESKGIVNAELNKRLKTRER